MIFKASGRLEPVGEVGGAVGLHLTSTTRAVRGQNSKKVSQRAHEIFPRGY
ncbi:MAG: hypothetical protein NZ901_12555 [Geminocystis sp.]|nr:hypothetical protein [Geminocystis sp.]MCX8077361.1 hypothetical protein [Geminocystis sp.]MDW8464085.1 hypothetical protein [Geminocystis sp.]HIK36449.1 hypothetical protein [Geminocystis sp. M7585_C2015_104]